MSKKAFSLIELLIVIMIIGVVYTLSIGSFQRVADESSKLSLSNFKEYLKSQKYTKSAKLMCLGDCSECEIYLDGNKSNTIEGFLDNKVKIYRYDFLYGFTEAQKDIFFNENNIEEDVCFSYEIDKSGAGEQVLVEFKEKYYDLSTYFDETPIYNSIEDAAKAREEKQRELI